METGNRRCYDKVQKIVKTLIVNPMAHAASPASPRPGCDPASLFGCADVSHNHRCNSVLSMTVLN